MTVEPANATLSCFGRHAASDPTYALYHDTEWGRPIHDDTALFERVCLEGFQVGLSWRTVLHKRQAFRLAFADFDPVVVAAFTDADVERLANNQDIIRNRAKIRACINGARIVNAMHQAGETLDDLIWGAKPVHHQRPTPETRQDTTPQSEALAKALRQRGFRFVGPVNTYATMQACGVVNDHFVGCIVGDTIDLNYS
ncbi:MAG: DNA-3-methyladenine glycosylase I [Propionibacteriaceae bacterium]|nr:DNA-3-methyladenine glycosylase I [Propionibacteriaceae bacterium]